VTVTAMKTSKTLDLGIVVRELVEPHNHLAILENGVLHRVRCPSLLNQLSHSLEASTSEAVRSPFGSRTIIRVDCLDYVILVDEEAYQWLQRLDRDDSKLGTKGRIWRLYSLMPQLTQEISDKIEKDLRRWHGASRLLTGWDTAPQKLRGSCPVCNKRDSLRARVSEWCAYCLNCGAFWPRETVGVLADHVRRSNGEG